MIYILIGNIETGKSKALLKRASERSDVYGILSPRDKDLIRYFLDLRTKETFKMQARREGEDTIAVGRYIFYRSAFNRANSILLNTVKTEKEGYIIIDELGKLELQLKGLHASAKMVIKRTMRDPNLHSILVIRTELFEPILKAYDIVEYKILKSQTLSEFNENSDCKITQLNINQ